MTDQHGTTERTPGTTAPHPVPTMPVPLPPHLLIRGPFNSIQNRTLSMQL